MQSTTESAKIRRINRRLAGDFQAIRRCREDSRWFHDLGRFYVVDYNRNWVVDKDVDLDEMERELLGNEAESGNRLATAG